MDIVGKIKEIKPETFVIADLKTLDTGNLEARMVSDAGADAVVISGLAPHQTIEKAIAETRKTGIYSSLDMLNVADPIEVIEGLHKSGFMPDVIELHRAIDVEQDEQHAWGNINEIKQIDGKVLVAVAGGVREETAPEALEGGADILIVGRGITNAKDVEGASRRFLRLMKDEIDQYRVMTDF